MGSRELKEWGRARDADAPMGLDAVLGRPSQAGERANCRDETGLLHAAPQRAAIRSPWPVSGKVTDKYPTDDGVCQSAKAGSLLFGRAPWWTRRRLRQALLRWGTKEIQEGLAITDRHELGGQQGGSTAGRRVVQEGLPREPGFGLGMETELARQALEAPLSGSCGSRGPGGRAQTVGWISDRIARGRGQPGFEMMEARISGEIQLCQEPPGHNFVPEGRIARSLVQQGVQNRTAGRPPGQPQCSGDRESLPLEQGLLGLGAELEEKGLEYLLDQGSHSLAVSAGHRGSERAQQARRDTKSTGAVAGPDVVECFGAEVPPPVGRKGGYLLPAGAGNVYLVHGKELRYSERG